MILLIIVSLLLLLVLLCLVLFKRQGIRNKIILNKHLSHFELSDNNGSLALFLPHQNKPITKISLNDIISSEIDLNDKVINTITVKHSFDCDIEQKIYRDFECEYRQKMMRKRIRKIAFKIQDKKKSYHFCLYLREGDQRLTRYKYKDVVKNLIALNWLINTEMESKRKVQKNGEVG